MGIKVTDRATGQQVEVSTEEAREGIVSGRFAVDGPVSAMAPDGTLGELDAPAVMKGLASGYRLMSPEEQAKERIRREESDAMSTALATAEAFGAGATLGGTTWLERQLGVDMERAKIRREEAGGLADLAELGGAVAPTLLTGGLAGAGRLGVTGAAKAGVRALGAPTRAATAAGEAVEAGLGALARRGGVASMVPTAARGAAEGALYGAGAYIDEASLGDKDLVAEQMLSAGLMGAAFGSAGNAAVGGLIKAARGGASLSRRAVGEVLERSGMAAGDGLVNTIAKAGARPLGKLQAMFTGGPGDTFASNLSKLGTSEGRKELLVASRHMGEYRQTAARKVQEKWSDMGRADDLAHQMYGSSQKVLRHSEKIPEAYADKAIKETADQLDSAIARLEEMHSTPGYGNKGVVKELLENVRVKRGQLNEAQSAKTAFRVADAFKRDIDGMRGRMRQLTSEDADTFWELLNPGNSKSIRANLRGLLEREDAWGPDAATAQKEINARISEMMDLRGKVDKRLRDGELESDGALNMVRSVGRYGRESKLDAARQYAAKRVEVLEAIEKHYPLDKEQRAAFRAAKQAQKDLEKTLNETSDMVATSDNMATARGYEGEGSVSIGAMSSLGSLAGFALGGIPGAIVGTALTRPHTTVRTLAGILEMANRVDTKRLRSIGSAVRRRLPESKGRKLSVAPIVANVASTREQRRKSAEDAVQQYRRDPQAVYAMTSKARAVIEHAAPNIANTLAVGTQRALEFLSAKAPKLEPDPITGRKPAVSPTEQEAWSRYADAVQDPLSILDRVANGSVTREDVEVMRNVYPKLYEQSRNDVMAQLQQAAEDGEPAPYQQRVSLGMLFDLPSDPSISPSIMLTLASIVETQDSEFAGNFGGGRASGAPLSQGYESSTSSVEEMA